MVQWQMYCPEQIIVPQKFPNILKTYAKAVIRTQPYDVLRWSAAYFRCLALNVPPPVKARLEKESRFGKLTKGYLKVLVEQLGKGFYVERDILQSRWETLSLPEDELLKFLSLCRMLHWSQIHWLELFAVMVGSLNDDFHSTIEMMFELLTDDPEGGPNPIPGWMFNVCYSFVAKLDCSEAQSFVNGRKILDDDNLEELNVEPSPPKIYSIDLFRYALIERFIQNEQFRLFEDTTDVASQRSFFSNQSNINTSFNFVGFNERENVANEAKDFKSVLILLNEGQREALAKFNDRETKDKIIQYLLMEKQLMKKADKTDIENISVNSFEGTIPTTGRSDVSSGFKFIGDLKNPYEALKKTANVDTVLMQLSKAQRNTLRNVTKRQTGDERLKEELFRNMPGVQNSPLDQLEMQKFANNADLSKGLEQPWSWVHQFATTSQAEKSYNFVEHGDIPLGETPTLLTDGSFDFCTGHFRENYSDFDQLTMSTNEKYSDETKENLKLFEGFIGEIVDNIGHAMSEGKCDLKNIKSICSMMSEKNFDGRESDLKIITDTLQKAEEHQTTFENLDQLSNYLKEECTNEIIRKVSIDPLSKKLMECSLEIDENVVNKEVPNDMILGLIDSKSEPATQLSTSSVTSIHERDIIDEVKPSLIDAKKEERKESMRIVEGFITDVIDDIDDSDFDSKAEESVFATFDSEIPPLPGIGKACTQNTIDTFLAFILTRAREEKGMVYPRLIKEVDCPAMIDSST